jgi:nitroimidazol reductase NimA-like FMN-containing flavoprotein (pyridoxamine 5'-phosphate oxidase superfamily)
MNDPAHPAMRRQEKQITSHRDLETILRSARVCRLAFADHNTPYVVPLHYGYKDNTLFFHCAPTGRKLDLISKNPRVCFEVETDHEIINTGRPCDWTTSYSSIIGDGTASLVTDPQEKRDALHLVITHYAPGAVHDFPIDRVNTVTIIKVSITDMTGKTSRPG